MPSAAAPAVLIILIAAIGLPPNTAAYGQTRPLENWLPIHEDVISGATPDGPAAFAELHQRGIRTVISVDGKPPDLKSAHASGLRYVHVPIGYDGIDGSTTKLLASAITQLPKPIYFHCHHGKHRGPAAAVAACIASGRIDPDRGEDLLRVAGTSARYGGLYRDVRNAKRMKDDALTRPTKFPDLVEPEDLVAMMLKLETNFSDLGQAIKARHQHRQQHFATMVSEQFREMARRKHEVNDTESFNKHVAASQATVEELNDALEQRAIAQHVTDQSITRIYRILGEQCKLCHQRHRD